MPRWQRQRGAIEAFAKASGYSIVAELYVAAVSGAECAERVGFAAMSNESPAMAPAPSLSKAQIATF
jgi:hypothetical protein